MFVVPAGLDPDRIGAVIIVRVPGVRFDVDLDQIIHAAGGGSGKLQVIDRAGGQKDILGAAVAAHVGDRNTVVVNRAIQRLLVAFEFKAVIAALLGDEFDPLLFRRQFQRVLLPTVQISQFAVDFPVVRPCHCVPVTVICHLFLPSIPPNLRRRRRLRRRR